MTKAAISLPSSFTKTALAFPDNARQAIEAIERPQDAAKALRGGDALLQLAKDLGATTDEVRAIQQGRLIIIDKLGELLPGKQGKRNDLTSATSLSKLGISTTTIAAYRKVHLHRDKIDTYCQQAEDPSMTDFIRWNGSGGTRHHAGSSAVEWYTPAEYIEAANHVMGGIDLDPASSDTAQDVVGALNYFTVEDDGLAQDWFGRVFLNPPYKMPAIKDFVAKLCESVESKTVAQAVLLTNNATDTEWFHQAANCCTAICLTRGRINFYNDNGTHDSPTHGQSFFYFGKRVKKFTKRFASHGICLEVMQ